MAASKKKKIKTLHSLLVKRYSKRPVVLPKERDLLDHWVYAMFLENNSFENASACFLKLESYFVDWNEVRVATTKELVEVFPHVDKPTWTGERLRRTLQWIFDKNNKFELQEIRAKGMEETELFLQSNPYYTPFINAYTLSFTFKMQDVPLDEGACRVLRLLDVVEIDGNNREKVEGLSSALTQADKVDFFFALHRLGAELMNDSLQQTALEFLAKVDPEVTERSWIPLVDNNEPLNPALIAKQINRKEQRPKLPASLSIAEEELIEEGIDDRILLDEDVCNAKAEQELLPPSFQGLAGTLFLLEPECDAIEPIAVTTPSKNAKKEPKSDSSEKQSTLPKQEAGNQKGKKKTPSSEQPKQTEPSSDTDSKTTPKKKR